MNPVIYIEIGNNEHHILVKLDDIVAVYPSDFRPFDESSMPFLVDNTIFEIRSIVVTPYGLLPGLLPPEELSEAIEELETSFIDLN